MRGVVGVAPVQPLPVYEVRATGAALPALARSHLLQLLEAVQIVLAVGRRALDVERRRFYETAAMGTSSAAPDRAIADRLVIDVIRKAFDEDVARDGPGIAFVGLKVGRRAPPVDVLPG